MTDTVRLYQSELEDGQTKLDVSEVAVCLKTNLDGCMRDVYFNGEEADKLTGPALLVFSIKRAKDILLENCDYENTELSLEVAGKRLPKLPARAELEKLLEQSDTLVMVNDSPYKPATEVYGFQQVYDDCFNVVEALKKLGVTQDNMAIFATPEEISVEIHHKALGIEPGEGVPENYYKLACHLANIKEHNGVPVKTDIKTLDLNAYLPDYKTLMPGSNHPTLHRTKVGVGASHFAYGIAAFSDYCGKKRTLQESLQEALNWIKFVEKEPEAIKGLKERIEQMPLYPLPGQGAKGGATSKGGAMAATSAGSFQPLKMGLEELAQAMAEPVQAHKSLSAGLDKALGGGWAKGEVHLVVGPPDSGKASFLLQQALTAEKDPPVLYLSYENSLKELVTRAAVLKANLNLTDLLTAMGMDPSSRKTLGQAVTNLAGHLSEAFYMLGVDSGVGAFSPESIGQLAKMIPGDEAKLVFIESLRLEDLGERPEETLLELKNLAAHGNFTVLMSLHSVPQEMKRPHYLDEGDGQLLLGLQRACTSLLHLTVEKVNLRKFVAMVKGQIDPALLGTLEQRALQLAGGKRYKTDTFAYARLLHSRYGKRELFLYLYQPDRVRFHEIASIPITKA
jgi:hypothetical protein